MKTINLVPVEDQCSEEYERLAVAGARSVGRDYWEEQLEKLLAKMFGLVEPSPYQILVAARTMRVRCPRCKGRPFRAAGFVCPACAGEGTQGQEDFARNAAQRLAA